MTTRRCHQQGCFTPSMAWSIAAPASSSERTMFRCPFWTATNKGVAPARMAWFLSAPASTSARTMWRCPSLAAMNTGVTPSGIAVALLLSAPAASSKLTTSKWSLRTAKHNGVAPHPFPSLADPCQHQCRPVSELCLYGLFELSLAMAWNHTSYRPCPCRTRLESESEEAPGGHFQLRQTKVSCPPYLPYPCRPELRTKSEQLPDGLLEQDAMVSQWPHCHYPFDLSQPQLPANRLPQCVRSMQHGAMGSFFQDLWRWAFEGIEASFPR